MAFRGGRGRGRGGYGRGGFRFAKQESVVLFPEVELPDRNNVTPAVELIQRNSRLRRYFRDSPYFLEDTLTDDTDETVDIERYSDKAKKASRISRESLLSSGYLKLEPGYFPIELVRGTKRRIGRKVVWNQKRDLKKWDFLEGLEEKLKDEDGKTNKEKEDGEEDDEDEENQEAEDDEFSDEGDYEQGIDFDDDEDDYNMGDDGDDEAIM